MYVEQNCGNSKKVDDKNNLVWSNEIIISHRFLLYFSFFILPDFASFIFEHLKHYNKSKQNISNTCLI